MPPDFLSYSGRARAAATEALAAQSSRRLDQLVIPDEDEFDAQITAVSGSDYSWLRQLYDPATGDFYADPAGLSGDTSWMPAREMNSAVISAFPFYARLTRRAVLRAADGSPVYEFMAAPSSAGTPTSYVYGTIPGAGINYNSTFETVIRIYTVTEGSGKYLLMSNISFFNNVAAGNTRYTAARITSPTVGVAIHPTTFSGFQMGYGLTSTVPTGSGWIHGIANFTATGNFTLTLVANLDSTAGVASADVYSVTTVVMKLG